MKLPILIFLAALLISGGAAAEVTLVSPENNAYSSINPQQFIFKTAEQPGNCSLSINGNSAKTVGGITANASSLVFYELLDNAYNWSVSCVSVTSTSVSQQYSLVMDTSSPSVKLQKPAGNARVNSTSVEFAYQPSDANLKSCILRVKINGVWNTLRTNISTSSGQNNSFFADLIDGDYDWNIICFDRSNNSGTSLFDRKVTVDTTPPSILSYTPFSVVTESSATLTITTDEAAVCRYSTAQNASFAGMSPFELTELTTHRQFLTGVSDGINTYYVKCVDLLGNEMSEQKVKLDVHLLPTAKITLSRPSPLKEGRLDVTLETSRDLIEPPELFYSFDSGTSVSVPLTGSGSLWEGTIIIDASQQKRLGKFIFNGKDIYGYKGTIISEGKTFIVDTIAPQAIGDLRGELRGGYPMLFWHSGDDDINYYEIYRSTSPGISFTDYRSNTSSLEFIDYGTDDRQTYYYRVSAVDRAGNKGALSNEIFVTAVLNKTASVPSTPNAVAEPAKPLPPNLVVKVNDEIKKIEAGMLTVNDAKAQLGKLSGEVKLIADDLGLPKKVDNANVKLQGILNGLNNFKASYHEEPEVSEKVRSSEAEMAKALAGLPHGVSIEEQTEFVQSVTKEDVQRATRELSATLGITSDNKDNYISQNLKAVGSIKISTRISTVKIESVDGSSRKITLFQKSLSYKGENPLEDVVVLEFIPKTVAESTNEIEFLSSVPEILKDDPVIKWGFVKLGFDPQPIKYAVGREVSFEQAKEIATVPLTSLSILSGQTKVTGLVTFPISSGASLTALLLVVTVVLLGYYYFKPVQPSGRKVVKDPVSYGLLTDINHKLTSMKLELDDSVNPMMKKINSSLEQEHEVSGIELTEKFVEIANQYLEAGQRSKAADLYHTITLLYQQLPKEQKGKIHVQCIELSRKLSGR